MHIEFLEAEVNHHHHLLLIFSSSFPTEILVQSTYCHEGGKTSLFHSKLRKQQCNNVHERIFTYWYPCLIG